MNAQQLIDECEVKPNCSDWVIEIFYPTQFNQKQADKNITKICKNLN